MVANNIPMDLWAYIAKFMTQTERIEAFFSLRRAMLIPTYNTLHETMHRFLEIAGDDDKKNEAAIASWPSFQLWGSYEEKLVAELGLNREEAIRLFIQHDQNIDIVLDLML